MIFFIGTLSHLERRQKSLPFVNPYGLGEGGRGGGSLICFSRAKDFHIYLLLPLEKLPIHLFA